MLQRARRRTIHPLVRIQALWNALLSGSFSDTRRRPRGLGVLITGARGPGVFAAGKLTVRYLPSHVPRLVVQCYPVLLALLGDPAIRSLPANNAGSRAQTVLQTTLDWIDHHHEQEQKTTTKTRFRSDDAATT